MEKVKEKIIEEAHFFLKECILLFFGAKRIISLL